MEDHNRGADEQLVKRLHREARALIALNHPNIVRAFEIGNDRRNHFLAMEYVQGLDLQRFVQQAGPLPVAQACEYVRQTALGLQYIFEQGMVHRDIKPSNLLVTADGAHLKILDLGLLFKMEIGHDEKTMTLLTGEGMAVGTLAYISPEQFECLEFDIRSDLYSLGCTFYCLLTGKPPFAGCSTAAQRIRRLREEPEPVEHLRPEISPELARVVSRLLRKEPHTRYQTPAELAHVLSRFADDRSAWVKPGDKKPPIGEAQGSTLEYRP